jgi:carbamoyltransferase
LDLLCDGRIVGWFAGGAELGPRALGQRSILCDPRRLEIKSLLNGRVKRREGFQPFAPSILYQDVSDWFDIPRGDVHSPFMLRVLSFKHSCRGKVPAVLHVDGTGRPQTVSEQSNAEFYHLIEGFKKRTGIPMLLNTSFNGNGEPIVETPYDALRCMVLNEIDCCVFPGVLAFKTKTE